MAARDRSEHADEDEEEHFLTSTNQRLGAMIQRSRFLLLFSVVAFVTHRYAVDAFSSPRSRGVGNARRSSPKSSTSHFTISQARIKKPCHRRRGIPLSASTTPSAESATGSSAPIDGSTTTAAQGIDEESAEDRAAAFHLLSPSSGPPPAPPNPASSDLCKVSNGLFPHTEMAGGSVVGGGGRLKLANASACCAA